MSVAIAEIWSIRGPVGSAKSTLVASFPGESFWFDLESGAHRATNRLQSIGEDISRFEPWHPLMSGNPEVAKSAMESLRYRPGDLVVGKQETFEVTLEKYAEVLSTPSYDNVIVDTWRELWYICHRAYLQELQQDRIDRNAEIRRNLMELDYATPNGWMDNWMSISKGFRKNLLLISHERPVRVQMTDAEGRTKSVEDPSGRMELDGYRHTLRKVDWSVVTGFEAQCQRPCNQEGKCPGWHFYCIIEKSPVGQELVGYKLYDPSYDKIIQIAQIVGHMAPPAPVLEPASLPVSVEEVAAAQKGK